MPASTPKLALPYPLGTDLIADGDDSIKALAERIETILSPTWTPMPYASGWTNIGSGYQNGEYTKVFGFLLLRGHAQSSGGTATVATLPVGFRVAAPQLVSVVYWGGSVLTSQFTLNTSGAISTSWAPASGHNFPIITPPIWVGP